MALRNRDLVPEKRAPVKKSVIVAGLVAAAILALMLRLVVHAVWIFPLRVGTASMEPAVKKGQTVYVVKRVELQFGDIILYKHPDNPEVRLLGRITGLPGDAIEMKEKQLLRNGAPVQDAWQIRTQTGYSLPGSVFPRDSFAERKITTGKYFVLCDLRTECLDSRLLGEISREMIVGRIRPD
ncbi:MAG TPA: signal peptidase I [Leptospiraceae bacterium]|nr:signal peptidase I [Leptospiraceae bacterium]